MERFLGPPDVICQAGREGSYLPQKRKGEFWQFDIMAAFRAMSGSPMVSESLVALDVFFLGITRRCGSPCAGCRQKQREGERFAVG